jgi:hypothetical protein
MKRLIVVLVVMGLVCVFEGTDPAFARVHRDGPIDGLPWLLALPLAIINLIIDLWVPLAIIGGVFLVLHHLHQKAGEREKERWQSIDDDETEPKKKKPKANKLIEKTREDVRKRHPSHPSGGDKQ